MVHLGEALFTQARGPKFNPQHPCTWQEGMTNLSVIPALKRQRQELSGASWLGREATSETWWLTEDSASIYKGESGQKRPLMSTSGLHMHTHVNTHIHRHTHIKIKLRLVSSTDSSYHFIKLPSVLLKPFCLCTVGDFFSFVLFVCSHPLTTAHRNNSEAALSQRCPPESDTASWMLHYCLLSPATRQTEVGGDQFHLTLV